MVETKEVTRVDYRPAIAERCEMVLLESQTETSYVVLDLTGASLLAQIRADVKQQDVIVEASTDNGKITIEPVTTVINGAEVTETGVVITLDETDTLNIYQDTIGEYAETDLQLTLPGEIPINGVVCLQYFACLFPTRPDFEFKECC